MRIILAFIMCSVFIYCGVNWFLLPMVPVTRQFIHGLTIWHSAGLSALLMIALLFVNSK